MLAILPASQGTQGHVRKPETSNSNLCSAVSGLTVDCVSAGCKVCINEHQYFSEDAVCKDCAHAGRRAWPALVVSVPILLVWGALHILYGRRSLRFAWVAAHLRRWVHHIKSFSASIGLIPKAKVSARSCGQQQEDSVGRLK